MVGVGGTVGSGVALGSTMEVVSTAVCSEAASGEGVAVTYQGSSRCSFRLQPNNRTSAASPIPQRLWIGVNMGLIIEMREKPVNGSRPTPIRRRQKLAGEPGHAIGDCQRTGLAQRATQFGDVAIYPPVIGGRQSRHAKIFYHQRAQ